MPQMAPYNWLILFLLFNFIILLLSTHIHYMMMKMPLNFKLLNKTSLKILW